MIAQAPLEGTAGIVVLHPVADEVADLAGIELDHDFHSDLAVGSDHESSDVFRKVQAIRRLLEVIVGRLEGLHQSAVPWINWTGRSADRLGPNRPDRNGRPGHPQWSLVAPPFTENGTAGSACKHDGSQASAHTMLLSIGYSYDAT